MNLYEERIMNGLIPFEKYRLIGDSFMVIIDVTASTTTFTNIAQQSLNLDFNFLLEYLYVLSETNALTKAKLILNEEPYPRKIIVIDNTPSVKEDNSVSNTDIGFMLFNNTYWSCMRINKFLSEQWKLKILSTNTHTSDQKQYFYFQGYRVIEIKTPKAVKNED